MMVLEQFIETRRKTVALCKPLTVEDYVPQTVAFASPPKWSIAHTSWFFEEMILKKFVPDYQEFDPKFSFLFNSYYNTVGQRTARVDRGNMTRPGVDEVYLYRQHVDQEMEKLLKSTSNSEVIELVVLGVNHEQQHQELLWTDIKYMLGHNPIYPVYAEGSSLVGDVNDQNGFVEIEEGVYSIGYTGDGFSFDNEHGVHKVFLHPFEISKSLVTNQEYMEFMESGGYENFSYWLDEGWSWVNENQINSPLYWVKIEGNWFYYTLEGLKPVDPSAILCHISFYEANAFATWKGMRLPTEFEWEVASDQFNWGKRWEWTNSAYLPYPNFKIADGAVGEYNGKFMVNQMVLRGASVATSNGHSRKSYRNFFHPHLQWQFSGLRLVK